MIADEWRQAVTWGEDTSSEMKVSWLSQSPQVAPQLLVQGPVYPVLGGGGTNKRDNVYGARVANVTTFTQIRTGAKPAPDSTEPAAWSAMTDPADAYGVAYFQVDPGKTGGYTTITVTYYHAPTQTSGTPEYTVLESFQLTRPRRDWWSGPFGDASKPALAVASHAQ